MSKNSQEPCECACLFSHAFAHCHTSKFRLASNISYSAFSVLQKTSENSFSFCYHHFSGIFVHLFNHSHIPHLISSPSISFSGCMSRTSHIQLFLLLYAIPTHFQHYFVVVVVFLLPFHFCWPIPSSDYPCLEHVIWVYHLETRKQRNCRDRCQYINLTTDTQ